MRTAMRRHPFASSIEARSRANRSHRHCQIRISWRGVGHGVGCYTLDPNSVSEFDEGIVAMVIKRVTVIPEFDEHSIAAEEVDESFEFATRCCWPLGAQR
jgi:hypothetical protein